jgi:hypothetical protein
MPTVEEPAPVVLPNGKKVLVQVVRATPTGEQDVALTQLNFSDVADAIEGIASALTAALKKVRPTKASVEFGIQIGVEAGHLTALIVKGTGTASLTVSLEWDLAVEPG